MPVILAIILIVLVEIGLFVVLGGAIGLWPTLALVVLSAVVGVSVIRRQGLATARELQRASALEEDPTGPLADGALVLLAGALLIAPGFLSDAVGLALTVPRLRAAIIAWAGPRMARAQVVVVGARARPAPDDGPIEAEYRDVTDLQPPDRRPPKPD